MITVDESRATTELVLEFMNAFRKTPITLQEFKNQRAKDAKSKRESYDSITGGLVPFDDCGLNSVSGTISSSEMQKIIDGNN